MARNWLVLGALVTALGLARRVRLGALLLRRPAVAADWQALGPSPDGEQAYPPQGATVANDDLLLTNHWNEARSELYQVDPESGTVLAQATLPSEATHTSGLAWDGEWLWAVDHAANTLYQLDRAATFETGAAVVEASYDTGLRGASGLTVLEVDDSAYLAVSDFVWSIQTTPMLPMGSARTYVVPRPTLDEPGSLTDAAILSYPNGGYSQGLTWDGTYLYESLNNLGTDRVEVLDVEAAVRERDGNRVTRLGSFAGPAGRIEDLATDGETLWTTDEGTYELYRLDALSTVRDRVVGNGSEGDDAVAE